MIRATEYLDAINCKLVIYYYPNQGKRFSCDIENGGISEGVCIGFVHGSGKSPREACLDYFNKICGKILILNHLSDTNRREFRVPDVIEVNL